MPKARRGLSSAEQKRQWREQKQRQRAKVTENPELLDAARLKERERWAQRRKEGKVKVVAEMNSKELHKVRKMRRESDRRYRKKIKSNSRQPVKAKERGRKKKNLNRSRVYRALNKATKENEKLCRTVWTLKKRISRAKKPNLSNSPKTRVNNLIESEGGKITETVKKKLLFGEVLTEQLKVSMKTKSLKKKHTINQIFSGKVMKKYRCLHYTKSFLSRTLSKKYRISPQSQPAFIKNRSQISERRTHEVINFFLREDITSVCPDKDAYVINYKNGKVKKRRRYLTGTLKELYDRYCSAVSNPVSYVTFARLKPFYCVMPKVKERDTCLCKVCENIRLFTESLHRSKILIDSSPKNIIASLCCPSKTEACLQRLCNECNDKYIIFREFNQDQLLCYKQWVKIPLMKYDDAGNLLKKSYRWDKAEKTEPASDVVITYKISFMDYLKHMHRHYHQQDYFSMIKTSLKVGDLYLHVDWSENYAKKKNREIQSAYFGASKEEVSFHTGMAYTAESKQGFCTISACNKHSPANIITHLIPILRHFFEKYPGTTRLFIQSDSPSTQYRNKEMFYLVSQYLPVVFPNITSIHYGYSESGHGKGAVDGIGGWCKNTVDSAVATGTDIQSIDQIVDILDEKSKKTIIMAIACEAHKEVELIIPKDLKTFEGTMSVHSFTWTKENGRKIFLASLSCQKCNAGESCLHFGLANSPLCYKPPAEEPEPSLNEEQVDDPQATPMATNNVRKGKVVATDWIAVPNRKHWCPGIVEKVTSRALHVKLMTKHGKKKGQYVWPGTPDLQQVKRSDVLCILQKPPQLVGKYFRVEECADIDNLLKAAKKF